GARGTLSGARYVVPIGAGEADGNDRQENAALEDLDLGANNLDAVWAVLEILNNAGVSNLTHESLLSSDPVANKSVTADRTPNALTFYARASRGRANAAPQMTSHG